MHEMSYAVRVADIVLDTAKRENLKKIRKVTVRCGEMLGIVPALLENAFAACIDGTAAEGAALEVETAGVLIRCSSCGKMIDPRGEGYPAVCPACGSMALKIVRGREFTVAAVEGDVM